MPACRRGRCVSDPYNMYFTVDGSEAVAVDTTDGHLIGRIRVPNKPHGLCVWPQPGRYSLGHTGVMR